MATGKRKEVRVLATRPVRVGRVIGVTRNVSASGVFFETNVDYAVGSKVNFVIELEGLREERSMLTCQGEIVRVEHRDGKVGIAAKIVASTLESTV